MITVYHYPACGTCKKALKWLKERGLSFKLIHIVESPPSQTLLKQVLKKSGVPLKKLFNTSGQSYRDGGYKEKIATMSEEEALKALAADGKLIKRPLLVFGEVALVGFKAEDYEKALT
jgi:arsenate reductase